MFRQSMPRRSAAPREGRGPGGPARRIVRILNPFVFAFCLACIWLGMREILELGGFVASGGPYAIEHEAPGWVWVIPLCIMLMVGSMLTTAFTSLRSGVPDIMLLSWSALFVSLGWNFLESGLDPGRGQGVAWGWIVCAGLFLTMGLVPLVPAIGMLMGSARPEGSDHRPVGRDGERLSGGPQGPDWGSLLAQAAMAACGAALGAAFFGSLSS